MNKLFVSVLLCIFSSASAVGDLITLTFTGNPMTGATGTPFVNGDFVKAVIQVDSSNIGSTGQKTPSTVVLSVWHAAGVVPIFTLDNTTKLHVGAVDFLGLSLPQKWYFNNNGNVFGNASFQENIVIANYASLPTTSRMDAIVDNGGSSTSIGYNAIGTPASGTWTSSAAAVPEPSTFALLGMGAVGVMIGYRRRKRHQPA